MKKRITIQKRIYYYCPVCRYNSTDREAVQRHFRTHTIRAEEVVYCNICGAGWYVNAYGEKGARDAAAACVRKHQEKGDADDVAAATFFLSEGAFGYIKKIKGGRVENGKKEDSKRNTSESI